MAENDGDKSQDATPHRRQQAREQGQIALSQDLSAATLLVTALSLMLAMGGGVAEYLAQFTHDQLSQPSLQTDLGAVAEQWNATCWNLGKVLLPPLGILLAVAFVVNLFQTGFLWLPEKLVPDLARIDPLAGFGRIFSLTNLVRLAMGVIKLLIVSTVAYLSLYSRRDEILAASAFEIPQLAVFVTDIILWTCVKISVALLVLAIFDYGFQWWKNEQDMKMTPQEMREEMKQLQGDPQLISRRRAVQRQLIMNRLSDAVPKADVVITNPTELAIAIQYDPEKMAAPIVVAKGADLLAQRIRRLALENRIPIIEKKPLAQALYKEVDLNHPIPDKMYAAVAEVLAYVYQLKGKKIPKPVV
ncbi:MAG TPA: flagellar biosynthesis protein FlhB [Pirellulales bacterium]|jgi:flagellar biosynthetic protein FlhB|nr:flagellar biosynthesis protein FlhB [Pirellulales bacterium]